jgi:hypothetical protein
MSAVMQRAQQLVRLNVNMNEETATALKDLSDKQGLSLTETIRRAIAIYKFVYDEFKSGRVVQTMDKDGNNKREIVLM